MARVAFLLLVLATGVAGALAFWTQSGAFAVDHPSFYGCALTPLVVALVSLVAAFTPFDRPGSAPLWAAPLVGLGGGVALAGLVFFPVSFVLLAPLLLGHAGGLYALARAVARSAPLPPPPEEPDLLESDELAPSWLDLDPTTQYDLPPEEASPTEPRVESYPALIGICAVMGLGLCASWRAPQGGARPLPLTAEPAPVVSMPSQPLPTTRIHRRDAWVEVNGADLELRSRLDRPQVVARLRDFRVAVEPCLFLEQGTVDGFFAIPFLNTYRLEPSGLALAHYAEGRRVGSGASYAWVRSEFLQGRLALAPVAERIQPLSRVDPAAISATISLDVDLERGEVLIDAVTRLERPMTVHKASFAWVKITPVKDPTLLLGLSGIQQVHPPEGPEPKQAEFLVQDGDVGRALRGRYGSEGPYEVIQQGELEHWLAVCSGPERLLVCAPDWAAEASLSDSRGTGHGLRENALLWWFQGDAVYLLYDLASTRVGAGRLSVRLPAGTYRNRMVLRALLPDEEVRALGRQAVRGLTPLR